METEPDELQVSCAASIHMNVTAPVWCLDAEYFGEVSKVPEDGKRSSPSETLHHLVFKCFQKLWEN